MFYSLSSFGGFKTHISGAHVCEAFWPQERGPTLDADLACLKDLSCVSCLLCLAGREAQGSTSLKGFATATFARSANHKRQGPRSEKEKHVIRGEKGKHMRNNY